MANVLEKIVNDKRVEVAQREISMPLGKFKAGLRPSTKSLFDALNQPKAGFIFECKKASPSKGLIRPQFDLDEILAAYTPYAAAISVLTDEKYFQGTYEYLAYVTARVPQPVLNKDFFISPYQVYLARHYHADAILLMLSVLDDETYKTLAAVAETLSLDILTEVSNADEMNRAIALKAKIIGVNNRNLRDLSTDLATTERLAPMLAAASHDFVLISESGIYHHEDVKRLSAVSNGFLVGSALMAQTQLEEAVKSLVFGDTKVCGITRTQDAQAALAAGATWLGLIFAPKSARYVSIDDAIDVTQSCQARYVGVFVDEKLEVVADTAVKLALAAVQLHGHEARAYRLALRNALSSNEIWQACALSPEPTEQELQQVAALLADDSCDRVLLDCKVGSASGGTGQQFDWRCLASFTARQKLVLAGGIGEHNITLAAACKPGIIDINSKVESAPGIKNKLAIERTINARRANAVSARD